MSARRSTGRGGRPPYQQTPPRSNNLPALQPRITSPAGGAAIAQGYSYNYPGQAAPKVPPAAAPTGPPQAEKDGMPFENLGYDRQDTIEDATKIMGSWDALASLAMARGESIPQTRMYLRDVIVKASNVHKPLQPISTQSANATITTRESYATAYAPRRHDPQPGQEPGRTEDTSFDHKAAKKDKSRAEEATLRYLSKGIEESSTERMESWQEVYGVRREDLHQFSRFGAIVYPAREGMGEEQWSVKPVTPSRRSHPGTPNGQGEGTKIPRRSLSPQPKRERERERNQDA